MDSKTLFCNLLLNLLDTKYGDQFEWSLIRNDMLTFLLNNQIRYLSFMERVNTPFRGEIHISMIGVTYHRLYQLIGTLENIPLLPFIQNEFTFPATIGREEDYGSAFQMIADQYLDEEAMDQVMIKGTRMMSTKGRDFRQVVRLVPVEQRSVTLINLESLSDPNRKIVFHLMHRDSLSLTHPLEIRL